MSDHQPDTPETPTDATPVDSSRRKLTGAALGMGAVFTLSSRPVWAGTCKTPSGFTSGNVSQHGTPVQCLGRSPGYWKEHPQEWPAGYQPGECSGNNNGACNNAANWSGGTLFHPLFAGDQFMANLDDDTDTPNTSLSLMQVMHLNGDWGIADQDNLGAHIVAALLNAKAGHTPVLDETAVTTMWREYVNKGYFEPTAGVQWSSATIVKYIKSTFK